MNKVLQNQERTGLWLIKIGSGVVVFFVLAIHLVVNHLAAPEGLLLYEDVVNYYRNPIVPVMEVIFLIVVISHALAGFRSILMDLNLPARLQRWIDALLMIVGTAGIVYGTWLVVVIVSRGKGL